MIKLTNLTNSASQQTDLISGTGESIPFNLRFLPRINGWVFDCSWTNGVIVFDLQGARLTMGPNILRQYRNQIDFGLMCVSDDGFEPQFIDDFVTGRVQLFLLSPADVANIELNFFSPAAAQAAAAA